MVDQTVKHSSFFDASFSIERIGYYILSVHFSQQSASYSIFEPGKNKFIALESFSFSVEHSKVDGLSSPTFLQSKVDWINKGFKSVNVVVENGINTLVPQALFLASEASTYLRFCQNVPEESEVSYDILKNTGAVNVYTTPKNFTENCNRPEGSVSQGAMGIAQR